MLIAETVPLALKDHESIHVSGYSEEKLEITKRFLVPKQLQEAGINEKGIGFACGLGGVNPWLYRESGLKVGKANCSYLS